MFRAMLDWRQSFGVDDPWIPWLLDILMIRYDKNVKHRGIEDEDL